MSENEYAEGFYKNLWEYQHWSGPSPNDDENTRAASIKVLIEKYVLPNREASGPLRILDIGCGRGWLTKILSSYGLAIGVDPLEAGVKKAASLFPDLEFRKGTCADILTAEGPGSFDLIVASEVIEHVENDLKKDFLMSFFTLLKHGGFAILTTPRGDLWNKWKRLEIPEQPVEQWITERELRKLCLDIGFSIPVQQRAFLHQFHYDWLTGLTIRRPLRVLLGKYPDSVFLKPLKWRCAFYQVILLQRP